MIRLTELHWCDGCDADTTFDRFDCAEHEGDCLELVCTICGTGRELAGAA